MSAGYVIAGTQSRGEHGLTFPLSASLSYCPSFLEDSDPTLTRQDRSMINVNVLKWLASLHFLYQAECKSGFDEKTRATAHPDHSCVPLARWMVGGR